MSDLKNDFDITTYLSGYGFELVDGHFLLNHVSSGRKVKVKLIEPNSAYKCGFQTMAISSVNRRFKKIECPVPQDQERADLIFIPILFGSAKIDRNLNNVIQIQGVIYRTAYPVGGGGYFQLFCASGDCVSIVFNHHYTSQIHEGDHVHCIVKISPCNYLLNLLTLIGLTKLS
jgi:hypothetical protein